MKYSREFEAHFSGYPVFSLRDVRMYFSEKGMSGAYAKTLVQNFFRKGKLKRAARATYTFKGDAMAVGFAFQPFYYGLQEALSLRNLWEQETNPVVITPRKVRSGIREFDGSNYVVKRIDRKMFYGFEQIKYYDSWVPVSTPEKTLIDFAYYREPLSREALRGLKKKIDKKKLEEYLKRAPKWVQGRVRKLARMKK